MTKRKQKEVAYVSRLALESAVKTIRELSALRENENTNAQYHLQQVYRDRNLLVELVARLARQLDYRVSHRPGEEPDWTLVTIELPTGTVGFNMPNQDAVLARQPRVGPDLVPDTMNNEVKRTRIIKYIRPDLGPHIDQESAS